MCVCVCVCVCVYLMEILLGAKRPDSYLETESLEIRADSDSELCALHTGLQAPFSLPLLSSTATLSECL